MDYPDYLPPEAKAWAEEHRELVQRVAVEFLRTGAWLPLKDLTRQLARERRPTALRPIFWHMPKPLGFVDNNPERAVLTPFGLVLTRVGRKLLEGFVAMLILSVERYEGDDSQPVITRADVAGLAGVREVEVTALSELLLRGAPFLGSGFGSAADEWEREVTDDIVRYWKVADVDDYLRIRAAELSQSPQSGWRSPVLASDDSPAAEQPQLSIRAQSLLGVPAVASQAPEDRDVFISHASEDKDAIARPLAEALRERGHGVWFDEFELVVGDNLRRSIDHGLAISRFGVVILSPSFFAKEWPQRELDGLTSREVAGGGIVILPVWHEVDHKQVASFSLPLADKLAVPSKAGIPAIIEQIEKALARGPRGARPHAPSQRSVLDQGPTGEPLVVASRDMSGQAERRSRTRGLLKPVVETLRVRRRTVATISVAIVAIALYAIDRTLSGSTASRNRPRVSHGRPRTSSIEYLPLVETTFSGIVEARFGARLGLLVTQLMLRPTLPKAQIEIHCHGCSPHSSLIHGTRKLSAIHHQLIPSNATLTIAITQPGKGGRYLVRRYAGSANPIFQELCLAPGDRSHPYQCEGQPPPREVGVPVSLTLPHIVGRAVVGETLTCSNGAWNGRPLPIYTYQWTREHIPIVGANAFTYKISVNDKAHTLYCEVSATNPAGSIVAGSLGVTIASTSAKT